MNFTPFHLKVLLHTYVCPERYDGQENKDATQEIINDLYGNSLVDRTDFPKITERGEKFVKMILATPLPEHRWIDPREVTNDHR